MEPFEQHELSDDELDALLPEWKAPAAPARLRAAVFPEAARPWWKNLWSASIRIPVPVALCLAVLLAAAWWQWSARAPSHAVIRDQQVQVQPVAELQPRIIRRGHVPN
jgi:hypothetical protein